MKYAVLALGILSVVGVVFLHIPSRLEAYSQHGIPKDPYIGPRFRTWANGQEVFG